MVNQNVISGKGESLLGKNVHKIYRVPYQNSYKGLQESHNLYLLSTRNLDIDKTLVTVL